MNAIVAIGGGEIGGAGYSIETTEIDKEIIRLTGKSNPRLLFVPTASGDSESYFKDAQNHFGRRLGCQVDSLYLIKDKLSRLQVENKIFGADIVYVGGGNTLKMMRVWRKLGVDKILMLAHRKGVVLAGVSAGAICWFDSGHSDSMSFYDQNSWNYIRVKGIGMIRGIFCPHFDGMTRGVERKYYFFEMVKKTGGVGIAVENRCAIEFVDSKYYRVLSSRPGAAAYKVYKKRGAAVMQKIEQKEEFMPIEELYKK